MLPGCTRTSCSHQGRTPHQLSHPACLPSQPKTTDFALSLARLQPQLPQASAATKQQRRQAAETRAAPSPACLKKRRMPEQGK